MRRVKVVSEATDLVPVLRSFDTEVKRDVFDRIIDDWVTETAVREEFGDEGVDALHFFDNANLVETQWESVDGGTDKAYRCYYTAFNINTNAPVDEIADVLHVAVMANEDFDVLEGEIKTLAGSDGVSARSISEKLDLPMTRLKSVIKRSIELELKGMKVLVVDE